MSLTSQTKTCDECASLLVIDPFTGRLFCNLCGWAPSHESEIKGTPSYIS